MNKTIALAISELTKIRAAAVTAEKLKTSNVPNVLTQMILWVAIDREFGICHNLCRRLRDNGATGSEADMIHNMMARHWRALELDCVYPICGAPGTSNHVTYQMHSASKTLWTGQQLTARLELLDITIAFLKDNK